MDYKSKPQTRRFAWLTLFSIVLTIFGQVIYRNRRQTATKQEEIPSQALPLSTPDNLGTISNPIQTSDNPHTTKRSRSRWTYLLLLLTGFIVLAYFNQFILDLHRLSDILIVIVVSMSAVLMTSSPSRMWTVIQYLRDHAVLWSFSVVCGFVWILMLWEILRLQTDVRGFYMWLMIWSYILFLFYGITKADFRRIAKQLSVSRWTGLLISFITIILILMSIEFALRNVFYFSNSYGRGLMFKRWEQEYWKPTNELGIRDYPIQQVDDPITRTLVLGDSFAAGFGVKNIEDTFPQQLGRLLGDAYHMYLVAYPGWNTDLEVDNLYAYPVVPDLLIHSYFLNDISYIKLDYLYDWHYTYNVAPPPLNLIVDNFFLPEFLYYNIYTQLIASGDVSYDSALLDMYRDDTFWRLHTEDLEKIITYVHDKNSDYIVLIWPLLSHVEESRPIAAKVEDFYRRHNLPVINLTNDLIGCDPIDLVVNPFDAHPNPATHEFAAKRLYEFITTGKLEPIIACPVR